MIYGNWWCREEYKEFQKIIKEDLVELDVRNEEEEVRDTQSSHPFHANLVS